MEEIVLEHVDRVLAVVPVHNRKEATLRFLKQFSRLTTDGFSLDVLIVDDGSTDGTSDAIAAGYPDVLLVKGDGNLWWAGAVNVGFDYAVQKDYDFVYTVNNDIEISPDCLQTLYDTLRNRRDAVCSSVFVDNADAIVCAGFRWAGALRGLREQYCGLPWRDRFMNMMLEADSLSTKSTLIPSDIVRNVGHLDSKHFPHNHSDLEYFQRVKSRGYSLVVNTASWIRTEGSDTNFHQLLLRYGPRELIGTFTDIKFGNNIRNLYYRSTVNNRFIAGHLAFIRSMIVHAVWVGLRVLLGRKGMARILKMAGRMR